MSQDRSTGTLAPIVAAATGIALLSLMDAFMKTAALATGAFTAAWLRAVIGTGLALPLWLATRRTRIPRATLYLHAKRGVVTTFMALTFFYALTKLPIAETIAIAFIAPLLALYIAAVTLGETVRRESVRASLLGLAGTLVIVGGRIGREALDRDAALGIAAVVLSALLYAWNLVLGRQQALLAPPSEIALAHAASAAVILGIAAPFFFILPEPVVLRDIGVAAILTVGGSLAFAWAYARAETQSLAPLEYTGFLWAALLGWLFFGEPVGAATLLGVALIVAGCVLATRRTRTPAPEMISPDPIV